MNNSEYREKQGKEPDVSYTFKKEQNIKITTKESVKLLKSFKMIHILPHGLLFTNEFLGFKHFEDGEIISVEEV